MELFQQFYDEKACFRLDALIFSGDHLNKLIF